MTQFETQDLVLARIDERTKIIVEEITDLKASVNKLESVVLTGNGKPSLVTRVSLLEDESDQQAAVTSSGLAATLEVTKTRLIEDGKFWVAVVAAIIAAIVAIFRQ